MRETVKVCFEAEFGAKPNYLFAAPGRTELGGNHTDHQCGCVLAAAVGLYAYAAVSPRDDLRICLASEGYPRCEMELAATDAVPSERGTPL